MAGGLDGLDGLAGLVVVLAQRREVTMGRAATCAVFGGLTWLHTLTVAAERERFRVLNGFFSLSVLANFECAEVYTQGLGLVEFRMQRFRKRS